ncbi:type-F conjugative transfer system pilin assembly family protein [Escherichia coli 8-415-05_S1_C1]|nr:type-F conjugative transfer system pilin assembly family protein [Escherichia coli 8-415-05_S1_C1]
MKRVMVSLALLLVSGGGMANNHTENRQFIHEQLQLDRQRFQSLQTPEFLKQTRPVAPQEQSFLDAQAQQFRQSMQPGERPVNAALVFVSFSMPAEELKQRVKDAAQLNIPVVNRLLATASRLDKTALGRRVLAENGLEGETMARFIAAGKKYPSPYVALPVWTRHGKEAGALLTEIRIEDDGMRVVLSEESRLRGGEDAQFAGLQASRNGQTLIADSADAALRLAQENPESGVVIRLHGEERLLNAARLTGGRITEPDELSRALRNVADAETAAKAEDPITLPPDEQQKLAEVQEKAARELAEQARRELLSGAPQKDEDKRDLLLSADDERRLRDGTERESRELDEAVREAVAGGRGARQQVREQMQRTEREWVVKMPEKEIEMEKTLGGD